MRFTAVLLLVLGISTVLSAQKAYNFWKPVTQESINLPDNARRDIVPITCQTYQLAYAELTAALRQAPLEYTEAARQPLLLDLPQADGTIRTFRVWESPIMAPELQAKYPELRSFAGTAADDSGITARLGIGPKGFYGFFLSPEGKIQTVRPYADGMTGTYMSYRLEDLPNATDYPEAQAVCGVEDDAFSAPAGTVPSSQPVAERGTAPVQLKKYRTAISAQAEYALFHGGTKTSVMNAIKEAIDFIVMIQERDFAMRLELIPNNDTLIYFDPDTDPYSGQFVTSWRQQNIGATNSRIGLSTYDFGHVFARVNPSGGIYVAGQASLSSICTINKASGGSSLPSPTGEQFYLIAAHEMGHQLSATHSFNSCPSSQDAQTPGTAFEPGSGSTIMSYNAVCGQDVIQNNADPYYHVGNLEQIQRFIAQEEGSTCGTNTDTGNTPPEVSIPLSNGFYIPISTPFVLTGAGTDADGDNLTYCWEEYDLGPVTSLGAPQGTCPLFRSYKPVTSPSRTFPKIQTLMANATDFTEFLPNYTRQMNFKLTVRDNHPGGGGTAISSKLFFNVTDQAGPFTVSYPNTSGVTWHPGEYKVVTWDVANTNKAPVNCQKVNILLSINGGFSYTQTLATNVANTGSYCIQVPNVSTSLARIRVEAADNIFFDISNVNFKINANAQPAFTFCPAAVFDTICLPAQYSTVISTAALMGFSDPVTFSVSGLPNGITASISPNPVVPGSEAVLTLDMPGNQQETTFNYLLKAEAGALTDSIVNNLAVYFNDLSGLSPKAPADGATGMDPAPTLRWNTSTNANTYEVQVASNPTFDPGVIVQERANITSDSFRLPVLLEKGTVYYWRFRGVNECGQGPWVGPFAFATLLDVCTKFESNDLPKNITGSLAITVESKINVPAGGVVSDVNIPKIQGYHEYFKDLEMHLISPLGTDVLLFKDKCPNFNGNFNFGFDDSKPGLFGCPPPNNGSVYKPVENLSAFNNQNAGGAWILRVKDNQISSGGAITGFELELCSSTTLNPPVLVNNNPLQLAPGNNAEVGIDLLKTEDANNSDDELVYTLLTKPAHGQLQLNWTGEMQVGAQFTQSDLNTNGLRYFDYGQNAGNDQFCFTVTDGEGGLIKDCFTITPLPLSAGEAVHSLEFLLAPNPATETVRISFGETLRSDTRIRLFNSAGQLQQTLTAAVGQQSIQLQIANLPKGIYAVTVDNAEGTGVRKLIVR